MIKENWVKTRDIQNITGLSIPTINAYLNSIWLGKYRRANRFYVCKDSLNRLYSFMLKKSIKSDRVCQAVKRLKMFYPEVEEIILELQ